MFLVALSRQQLIAPRPMGTQFLFQPHHLGTSSRQGILGGSGYAEGIEMFSGGFMFLSCVVVLALRCKKALARFLILGFRVGDLVFAILLQRFGFAQLLLQRRNQFLRVFEPTWSFLPGQRFGVVAQIFECFDPCIELLAPPLQGIGVKRQVFYIRVRQRKLAQVTKPVLHT
ncbi:hypothetical protein Z046_32090 [Pseudomonas aeruginosa VRFPA09]|nr:hypothetical protein Z046_32090 [Pseudomonas aeruginosa VRFPA09]